MTGKHTQRTQRYGLIGVGIDVHESDVRNEGRGGGADIPAPRDDGEDCPAERDNQQPPSTIVDAQQQPRVAA